VQRPRAPAMDLYQMQNYRTRQNIFTISRYNRQDYRTSELLSLRTRSNRLPLPPRRTAFSHAPALVFRLNDRAAGRNGKPESLTRAPMSRLWRAIPGDGVDQLPLCMPSNSKRNLVPPRRCRGRPPIALHHREVFTPLHALDGKSVPPSGLCFERHHAASPRFRSRPATD